MSEYTFKMKMRMRDEGQGMYELLEAIEFTMRSNAEFEYGIMDEAVEAMFLARITAIRQAVEGSNDVQEA